MPQVFLINGFLMSVSSASEPRRYLIAIGSPYCPNMELYPLAGVKTDIERVVKLFTNEAQGYERVLADQIRPGATASTIKNALSAWFSSSERKASDCVIIYYAGHGSEKGNFGSHYLFTVDSDEDNLSSTAIETSELVKCLFEGRGERSANILLILDVCYAGQGGDQLAAALSKSQNVIKGSGFWVIASVDSNTEAGDGTFVDALSRAMRNFEWMSNQDEFINPHDLIQAVNKYLAETGLKAETSVVRSSTKPSFIRNPKCQWNSGSFLEAIEENLKELKNKLKNILQLHNAQFCEMQQAYQAMVKAEPFKRRTDIETIEALITELVRFPKGSSDFTDLEEFAAWLTVISKNDDLILSLQSWGQQHCRGWSKLVTQIKQRQEQDEKVQTALLIMISYSDEAATQGQDGEVYRIQVWLIKNVEQYKRDRTGIARLDIDSDLTGDRTYSLKKIPEILNEIFKAGNLVKELSEDAEVHIFLPQNLLNEDVDRWEIICGKNLINLLGHEYKVFVRMSQRLERNFNPKYWKDNWEQQKQMIQKAASNFFISCDDADIQKIHNFYNRLKTEGNKRLLGIKLTKAPCQHELEEIFDYIFDRDFPFAIWTRFDLCSNKNKDELERILETSLGDLPKTIKLERLNSFQRPKDSHIGHHLSLLWDDPDLVPPKSA